MPWDSSDKTAAVITAVGALVAGVVAVQPQLPAGLATIGAAMFVAGGTYWLAHQTVPAKPPAP